MFFKKIVVIIPECKLGESISNRSQVNLKKDVQIKTGVDRFKGTMRVIPSDSPFSIVALHYSFSRSKYFHLLIAPIEGFITLIGVR